MSNAALSAIKTSPVRTAGERELLEAFASAARDLPGAGWVGEVRRTAIGWLEANGLPSRRVEAYKYTDLRERIKQAWRPAPGTGGHDLAVGALEAALGPMAAVQGPRFVFVDGVHARELSRTDGSGPAAELMALGALLSKAPAWLEGKFAAGRLGPNNAMTALNTAFMSDGVLIKVKASESLPAPVFVVSLRTGAEPRTAALRHVIAMEPGSSATVIEVHAALPGAADKSLASGLSDVSVADGATLTHIKCVLDPDASHLSNTFAKVGARAGYRLFQMTAGPRLARNEINVELAGEGSKLDISGAFLGQGNAHLDTTLVVDHKVPDCQSRELFKGVLADRARGVFQGKIVVRPGALKTDGKQMARALLLSEDAEFDSKPELEIYADDVACGHGATAAALDEDLMFYCRSRGIPEAEARGLLIEAFIGEAIDKIEDGAIREAVMEISRRWLAEGGGRAAVEGK